MVRMIERVAAACRGGSVYSGQSRAASPAARGRQQHGGGPGGPGRLQSCAHWQSRDLDQRHSSAGLCGGLSGDDYNFMSDLEKCHVVLFHPFEKKPHFILAGALGQLAGSAALKRAYRTEQ